MAQHMLKKVANEAGSTLIEFAAVLSILLSLTFAMIDFGRYVYANNVIQAAAQEGASAGLRSGGNVESAVLDKILTLDPGKVSVSSSHFDSGIREKIQVDVTYQFSFITPFISAVASDPIVLEGRAIMLTFPEAAGS